MIATAIVGFGMAGTIFFFDILMGDVVDEDYLEHGVKRSASFYGTNAFIHRFSIILVISTIALVFTGAGWAGYDPNPGVDVIIGLKLLLFLFPSIALVIAIVFLKSYDLHGEKLAKMIFSSRKEMLFIFLRISDHLIYAGFFYFLNFFSVSIL